MDRNGIVNAIYHGTVLPLDGVVVRGVPGYQGGVCGDRCTYDQDRAKQLLAAAFPPGGPPIPAVAIDFDDDPTQQAVANAIAANLTTIGIATTLRPKPLADYQQFTTSGQLQLFHLGWIGAHPSPEAFLGALFSSGARSNLTNLADPGIDFALGAARSEPDETKRLAYYAVAEKAVMNQLQVLPIAQYEVPAVIATRVRNLDPTTTGGFDSARVWLAS